MLRSAEFFQDGSAYLRFLNGRDITLNREDMRILKEKKNYVRTHGYERYCARCAGLMVYEDKAEVAGIGVIHASCMLEGEVIA